MCTSGQPDNPCVDTNAACQLESGTYTCVCKSQYYENNAGVCAEVSLIVLKPGILQCRPDPMVYGV